MLRNPKVLHELALIDMRFRQNLLAFVSLRLYCCSQLSASGCTAATTLPAPWAVLGARFWPSGVLALLVGSSQPTTSRTIYVNAPLTTTRVGQFGLQAPLQRLGVLGMEIGCYSHSFRTGDTPAPRRALIVDNFRPSARVRWLF